MKHALSSLLVLAMCSGIFMHPAIAAEERMPISISESSSLPLRVLTRPHATLYAKPDETTVVQGNLPTFQSYFVYDRPVGEAWATQTGWYEVGTDDKGSVVGWIKGEDVFEWKQTMCLAYTHPEGRKPVLMFDDQEVLESLTQADPKARTDQAESYYSAIDAAAKGTPLPEDFPIISIEPKMAVDITSQFYLLPILEHKTVTVDGRESRLLRIAAVSNNGEKSGEKSDIRTNKDFLSAATVNPESQAKKLEELKIDLVWVIDTTRSMEPYIKAAHGVMEKVSREVAANPVLNGKIAFGAWGYRDSEFIPNIGYDTKNYTPELQPIETFLESMKTITETSTDSVDVEENMFTGVANAIEKTAWRADAMRIIILVGDAPAHGAGHKWNSSGQDENTLRALASDKKVTVFSLHIMPPATKKYNKIAERQFKALAVNPGQDKPMYGKVLGKNMEQFNKNAETIAEAVIGFGSAAAKGNADALVSPSAEITQPDAKPAADTLNRTDTPASPSAEIAQPDAKPAAGTLNRSDVDRTIRAAAVTWLGSQVAAQAPRDIEAWVIDKDLINTDSPSLEVRLLLNKRQLDSLATLLREILKAGLENQLSGDDFFTSLQSASAVVSRNPDMLANVNSLAESGLIPDFLAGLPYHSQLMDISNELWASWGPDEQNAFLAKLQAKCNAYATIHDSPELWIALNPGDDPAEHVTPVQLDLMP